MNARSLVVLGSLAAGSFFFTAAACSSSSSPGNSSSSDGGSSSGASSGGSSGGSSGSTSGGASSSSGGGSSSGSSSGTGGASSSSGGSSGASSSSGAGSSGGPFPAGTICNSSGTPLTPPATLKNLIVIMLENENYASVNGATTAAPYINSLATQCGVATAYDDNCFGEDNLESQPHYMALTSGSNCDTGNDQTGTSCITEDETSTSQGTLSTTSIFNQVASWKAYQESMPSACDTTTPASSEYAAKHNPAVFYTQLTSGSACTDDDLAIAALTCNASTPMTSCGTPSNAFVDDLNNDTLSAFTFVTPNLLNDMHDGTVTQADNWLYTYMPIVFASKAYLRGDVAVFLIWDEQDTLDVGGPEPSVFISPYITAATSSSVQMNHYSVLRAFENALGITTYLGCASGQQPGDAGACPAGSTADVRAALNF